MPRPVTPGTLVSSRPPLPVVDRRARVTALPRVRVRRIDCLWRLYGWGRRLDVSAPRDVEGRDRAAPVAPVAYHLQCCSPAAALTGCRRCDKNPEGADRVTRLTRYGFVFAIGAALAGIF